MVQVPNTWLRLPRLDGKLMRASILWDFYHAPGSGRLYWFLIFIVQLTKLAIILSQPNSEGFKYWFYRCFQYPPYSWDCRIGPGGHAPLGMPFPMPYSLLWYTVYVPLTYLGYWWFNFTMLAVDSLFMLVVARHHTMLYTYYYIQMSLYFLLVSPQDFVMWLLIILGRIDRPKWAGPFFLAFAIMWKLPLLPPIFQPEIWNFIFNNPWSGRDILNWPRYLIIGVAWLTSWTLWLRDTGNPFLPKLNHIQKRVQNRLIGWMP